MTFTELGLLPVLEQALVREKITVPTAIQVESIPVLLSGANAYVTAETGTGKTLAYLLPLFCRIDPARDNAQAIVLLPTHELAIQIQRQACSLAQNSGLLIRTLLLVGGTSITRQLDKLKKKPHMIIGSPGRIRELLGMRKLKVQSVTSVVIDEADTLLAGEGLEGVREIVAATADPRQLIFVSATEQPACSRIASDLAHGMVTIRTAITPVNSNIEHFYLVCEERDKPEMVRKLLHALNPVRALIFVHRNTDAADLAATLIHHKMAVADLHAANSKEARKMAMDDIRSGRAQALIASDVAARGLDIKDVTHVFNLDLPTASKAYLHRVGRTGRAGAKGYAVSLMTDQELRLVRRYEADLGIKMTAFFLRDGAVQIIKS